jgi:hypothetical protein
VREKAENEGFRRERGQTEGGGNEAQRRQKVRESLLIGTRATDVGGRENHGKLACLPKKMGAKKRSYASAIIGVKGGKLPTPEQVVAGAT